MKGLNWWQFALIALCVVLFAACANDSNETNGSDINDTNDTNSVENENEAVNEGGEPEEATVVFGFPWGEGGFTDSYKVPIEEGLPHITLEFFDMDTGSGNLVADMGEWVAADVVPDIMILGAPGNLREVEEAGLNFNLDQMIERHNSDLSLVNESILQQLRNQSAEQELWGIPPHRGANSLYYNKDIFDAFGVSYPDDGMTWDEVINLARDVTGEVDGVEYIGFDVNFPEYLVQQKPVVFLDPETDEPILADDPDLHQIFQVFERLWTIPGIFPSDVDEPGSEFLFSFGGRFFEDQNIAMSILDAYGWAADVTRDTGMEWDVATVPVFEDQPNQGVFGTSWVAAMTSTAENQDATWEVLEYMLSEEFQTWQTEEVGWATVLDDPEVQGRLGANDDIISEKNIEASFALEPSPGLNPAELSEYHYITLFNDMAGRFANEIGTTDINTLFREWEEELETAVQEEKASQ